MKINWTDYIAANNPEGVNTVLENYGYLRAYDEAEFPEAIDMLLNEKGDQATIDLLKQHPDYDIIVETYRQSEGYKNATGNEDNQPKTIIVQQEPPKQVVSDVPNIHFSATLQNVILVVMTFWLINKIISK